MNKWMEVMNEKRTENKKNMRIKEESYSGAMKDMIYWYWKINNEMIKWMIEWKQFYVKLKSRT